MKSFCSVNIKPTVKKLLFSHFIALKNEHDMKTLGIRRTTITREKDMSLWLAVTGENFMGLLLPLEMGSSELRKIETELMKIRCETDIIYW